MKINRPTLRPTVIAATLLVSGMSAAQAGEYFMGANLGSSSFDALSDACDDINNNSGPSPINCRLIDDSDDTASLNAGYNFNDYFGLEVGYVDVGEYQATSAFFRFVSRIDVEADITYLSGNFTLPMSDQFSVTARLGVANTSVDFSSALLSDLSEEDDTSAFVGLSADYRFSNSFGLQIRHDAFDGIDVTSAGLRYYF